MQGTDPHYVKVIATAKHYAVHSGPEPSRHEFDVKPADRDLVETYLPAFKAAVTEACERLMRSGRVRQQEPEVLAAQLWSFVHGYITLELAEHFVEFDDPVAQVLVPMGVNLAVGLGDERERAEVSHEAAARLYDSAPELAIKPTPRSAPPLG